MSAPTLLHRGGFPSSPDEPASVTPFLLAALLAVAAPVPAAPAFRVVDGETLQPVSLGEVLTRCAKSDIVLIGEQHGDPTSHAFEMLLLVGLAHRRQDVVLSMEQFERDTQPALDAYLAGTTTEAEFLAASRPWSNYPTDYRPLIEYARSHHLRVRAANLPRPLASRIARTGYAGFVATITPEESTWVPREMLAPADDYFAKFQVAMGGHPGGEEGMPADQMQRVYESQCAKDETMAESIIAEHMGAAMAGVVLHTTGQFHSDWFLGTTARVRRRDPHARIVTVSVLAADADLSAQRGRATFLVLPAATGPSAAAPAMPKPTGVPVPGAQPGGPLPPPKD